MNHYSYKPTAIQRILSLRKLSCVFMTLSLAASASGKQSIRENYLSLIQSRKAIERSLKESIVNTQTYLNKPSGSTSKVTVAGRENYSSQNQELHQLAAEICYKNLALLKKIQSELESATTSARALGITVHAPSDSQTPENTNSITLEISLDRQHDEPLSRNDWITFNLKRFEQSAEQATRALKNIRSKQNAGEKLSQAHGWVKLEITRLTQTLHLIESDDLPLQNASARFHQERSSSHIFKVSQSPEEETHVSNLVLASDE